MQSHSVLKSLKKSHSTLRAKRAAFTFWVDKKLIKNTKKGQFWEFLKTWNSNDIFPWNCATRQVDLTKICEKSSNQTFWVIFKQCAPVSFLLLILLCVGFSPKVHLLQKKKKPRRRKSRCTRVINQSWFFPRHHHILKNNFVCRQHLGVWSCKHQTCVAL